ncbi:MAG: hypothetical protein IPK14_27895 [Blastocatellia bacterium]|nr:hypothetical protein [Blastocatellia bacterium]
MNPRQQGTHIVSSMLALMGKARFNNLYCGLENNGPVGGSVGSNFLSQDAVQEFLLFRR